MENSQDHEDRTVTSDNRVENQLTATKVDVYKRQFLSGFKAESMPHFQQEVLQVVKNGLLQVVFCYYCLLYTSRCV